KLFVGGISWNTNEESLTDYFQRYGTVIDAVVMRDSVTQRSRGFGFVTFADPKSVTDVLSSGPHVVCDREIDPKRAIPRSSSDPASTTIKKLFLGGLASSMNEDSIKNYFVQFGEIEDALCQRDRDTGRPRGFGFITFKTEEAAESVLRQQYHTIDGNRV
ncbi:uncharacterized protein MONBRDRAFT_2423, partial [Monosiga brevicollis MX1]